MSNIELSVNETETNETETNEFIPLLNVNGYKIRMCKWQ